MADLGALDASRVSPLACLLEGLCKGSDGERGLELSEELDGVLLLPLRVPEVETAADEREAQHRACKRHKLAPRAATRLDTPMPLDEVHRRRRSER